MGILLRLVRYVDNRSLWLDEAALALNLINLPVGKLVTQGLFFSQSAPPGFLAVEKAAVGLLGDDEMALRLFPLLSGIAALVLFQHIAARLLPPATALFVLALFAVNEPLVYYSAEVKPYSSDVAIAALLVLLYLRFAERDTFDLRRVAPLAVAGTIAVWFSFPAVFVLAGVGLALMLTGPDATPLRRLGLAAAVGGLCLASFAAMYRMASETISTISRVVFGGAGSNGNRPGQLVNTLHEAWGAIVDPGGFPRPTNWLAAAVLAVGVGWTLAYARPNRKALLLVPGIAAFVAALLDKYPAAGRFWLFLLPFGLVVLGLGVSELVRRSGRLLLVAVPLVCLLVVGTVQRAGENLADPPRSEHIRPLLSRLVDQWRNGDVLYVYSQSQYALRYYAECANCDVRGPFPWPVVPARNLGSGKTGEALESAPPTVIIGTEGHVLAEVAELRGRSRVWLLFTSVLPHKGETDEDLALADLDRRGRRLAELREKNASLYLYDLLSANR
ncbi:MAG: glycosyltransferase family 39 protein [Actinobacteria bacterium]|nr:glycosyltransferase family 39 protein [Actinomycetota bacterium]